MGEMNTERTFLILLRRAGAALTLCVLFGAFATVPGAQRSRANQEEVEFGPVVRAYLGYLKAQQEVVDDRASRREIDRAYYLKNSNRIRALRQMAVRIARASENDFLPELEAVAADEFDTLFDAPPKVAELRESEVLNFMFRFLGAVTSGREKFYLFERLDPYEQAELRKKAEATKSAPVAGDASPSAQTAPTPNLIKEPLGSRPRRANSP